MDNFDVLEPAVDPANRMTFLLDWELTMKCNLDCSYCGDGLYGGHDNSTKHPPKQECFKSIDFMLEYADIYMSKRRKSLKHVVINVYGGEALHHPDIEEILCYLKKQHAPYQNMWSLKVTTTTNAIISWRKLQGMIDHIDDFIVSYHTESTEKQKENFRQNILALKANNKRVKCIIMMHADPARFSDAQQMIEWCNQHNIEHMPKQIDHGPENKQFNHTPQQIVWFENLFKGKSFNHSLDTKYLTDQDNSVDLSDSGRACCGGRQLCADLDYKKRLYFVGNKFPDWYCSVNEFFLFVKQINGEVYVNKDCKMNFDGSVGPIGNLNDTQSILMQAQQRVNGRAAPIQCKKYKCHCGLCSPKAKDLDTYQKIMEKYLQ